MNIAPDGLGTPDDWAGFGGAGKVGGVKYWTDDPSFDSTTGVYGDAGANQAQVFTLEDVSGLDPIVEFQFDFNARNELDKDPDLNITSSLSSTIVSKTIELNVYIEYNFAHADWIGSWSEAQINGMKVLLVAVKDTKADDIYVNAMRCLIFTGTSSVPYIIGLRRDEEDD